MRFHVHGQIAMRRQHNSSSESDSTDESNFKRSKRFKRKFINTEDEVDKPSSKFQPKSSHHFDDLKSRSSGGTNGVKRRPICYNSSDSAPPSLKKNRETGTLERNTFENGQKLNATKDCITFRSSATEIMKQMGFSKEKGLGKLMSNREISASKLDSIQSELQKVGIYIDDSCFDFEEEISVEEEVQWIPPTLHEGALDLQSLLQWRKLGKPKTNIADETNFVNPGILNDLLALKKCFNVMTEYEYIQVRSRCNPFETIGKGPFICRAGMKMANMDAILSFALTQPTTPTSAEEHPGVGSNELFYFADVCAGPGGFSEYILFKKNWTAKGFGMTLKGGLDFDIGSFYQGSPESFEPFYGPAGDGDVYNPANTSAFLKHVMASTDGRGVHLMMADGGFEVENKEMQEISSSQIYLSQCFLALAGVRPGGMFICKLFDSLTPFTVGLIYLMYISFDLVAIHKPNTSRPANSERYLICKWKKQDTEGVMSYLGSCHTFYWKLTLHGFNRKEDLVELVPMPKLKENKEFYDYIVRSNNAIASQQIEHLKRMVVFSRDPNLVDLRQDSIRKKCCDYWKIPEASKRLISVKSSDSLFKELLGAQPGDFIERQEYPLTANNIETYIRSPFDWRIVVIEATAQQRNRGFYLSLGGKRIYRHNGQTWVHILEKLELCKHTLVYGEFVNEVQGKKPSQSLVSTFHIIDAMILGGRDVRSLHYTQRHEVCVKFAKSMNKPALSELCAVRAKNPVRMENIADVFDRLENRQVVGNGTGSHLVCPVDHTDETLPFIQPAGILFLKITKDPWTMALSRSSNRKYYFNLSTGKSSYIVPEESISNFDYTMQHRMVWWWEKELKNILSTQDVTDETREITTSANVLNPRLLLNYINSGWQANKTA